ncbi:hypothetical protein L9F63_016676, partial [Diploptera punctata]
ALPNSSMMTSGSVLGVNWGMDSDFCDLQSSQVFFYLLTGRVLVKASDSCIGADDCSFRNCRDRSGSPFATVETASCCMRLTVSKHSRI